MPRHNIVRSRELSPVDKLDLRQQITRNWIGLVSPSEYMVIDYIFDRTVMWGRISQRITLREFKNGNKLNRGLSLSERTISSSIKSLLVKGLITSVGSKRVGNSYALAIDWGSYQVESGLPAESSSSLSGEEFSTNCRTVVHSGGNRDADSAEASREGTFEDNTSLETRASEAEARLGAYLGRMRMLPPDVEPEPLD